MITNRFFYFGGIIINILIKTYTEKNLPDMVRIWNEVVEDGHYEDICPYYHEL